MKGRWSNHMATKSPADSHRHTHIYCMLDIYPANFFLPFSWKNNSMQSIWCIEGIKPLHLTLTNVTGSVSNELASVFLEITGHTKKNAPLTTTPLTTGRMTMGRVWNENLDTVRTQCCHSGRISSPAVFKRSQNQQCQWKCRPVPPLT